MGSFTSESTLSGLPEQFTDTITEMKITSTAICSQQERRRAPLLFVYYDLISVSKLYWFICLINAAFSTAWVCETEMKNQCTVKCLWLILRTE